MQFAKAGFIRLRFCPHTHLLSEVESEKRKRRRGKEKALEHASSPAAATAAFFSEETRRLIELAQELNTELTLASDSDSIGTSCEISVLLHFTGPARRSSGRPKPCTSNAPPAETLFDKRLVFFGRNGGGAEAFDRSRWKKSVNEFAVADRDTVQWMSSPADIQAVFSGAARPLAAWSTDIGFEGPIQRAMSRHGSDSAALLPASAPPSLSSSQMVPEALGVRGEDDAMQVSTLGAGVTRGGRRTRGRRQSSHERGGTQRSCDTENEQQLLSAPASASTCAPASASVSGSAYVSDPAHAPFCSRPMPRSALPWAPDTGCCTCGVCVARGGGCVMFGEGYGAEATAHPCKYLGCGRRPHAICIPGAEDQYNGALSCLHHPK